MPSIAYANKVPLLMAAKYCDGTYRMKRQDSAETVIEYVVKGRGYLNINGENYAATAGDVYILRMAICAALRKI